jgi:hypothetical protein
VSAGEDRINDAEAASRAQALRCQAGAGSNLTVFRGRVFQGSDDGCTNSDDATSTDSAAVNGSERSRGWMAWPRGERGSTRQSGATG